MNSTAVKFRAQEKPTGELSELAREVPSNLEAEQGIIGAIILNNNTIFKVSDFLLPEHFYDPLHGRIYDGITKLIRADKIANPITLKTYFADVELLGGTTIQQYFANLVALAPTIIDAEAYGRQIWELYLRRKLIDLGENIVNDAYDNAVIDENAHDKIERAEKALFSLAETGHYEGGFSEFSESLAMALTMAGNAYERDGHLSGLATYLTDIDRLIGGLQSSDLIVIAGRPAMGKTAFATNIGFNIAKQWQGEKQSDNTVKTIKGGIVGLFSLEMSAEQLATRIIAEQAGIPSSEIRRGQIDEFQYKKIVEITRQLQHIPLYIDQTGGLDIKKLMARARRLKRQKGLDLLIIDYIQLLQGSKRRNNDSRVQEMTEITTSLKALAKDLNIPIIALSQLSRQVENRDDKRPQLADLRESGSIEQDADIVMFIFREEYYLKNRKPKEGSKEFAEWMTMMEEVGGQAEVIVAKQRHGPTGTVKLQFEDQVTRFANLAKV